TLALNDGGAATYTSGSGSNSLTFSDTVAAGQNTSDLTVTAFNLNGATVRDGAGNNANLAGAVTNPPGILTIDTVAPGVPIISQVTDDVIPITGVVANGGSTDDTPPTVRISLSGTNAAAGDQVQLFNGTSALGSAIVLTSGDISTGFVDVTTAALAQGTYNFNAKITDVAGNPSGASSNYTVTIATDTTSPTVSSIVASGAGITNGTGDLNAGKVVTLTVAFSEAVTVNSPGGAPTLALNDGGAATYTSGSGSNSLIFSYTVAAGENTSDLTVTAFKLNGATVRDAAGNDANLAGAVTNPSGTLIIDTSPPGPPTIPQVSDDVLPVTGVVANGGSTNDTTPTIRISLSGTNAAAGDQVQLFNGTSALGSAIVLTSGDISTGFVDVTTAALAQGTYNFNAKITDIAGNTSGASSNYTVTIATDTTSPTVSSIVASGAGITNGTGDLNAGKVVTLTVAFSEAVTVNTSGGAPTLALNDGGAATYTSGSGSNSLIFSYTVAAGENTSDLTVTAFKLNGATVRDAAGNDANLAGAVTNPSGTLIIDTSPPGPPTISQVSDDVLPVTGVVANGGSTNDTTPTVRINLSGTNAAAGDQVQLFNGTSALGSAIVLTSGDISTGFVDVTTAALAQGTYNFNAKITDIAGNTSGASSNYTVTIATDTTSPTVSSIVASGA